MQIEPRFKFGDMVFNKASDEPIPRIVIGYRINPGDVVQYICAFGVSEEAFYHFELTKKKPINIDLN